MDKRRQKLKAGLSQLTLEELQRIIDYGVNGGSMVYDNWNFDESTGLY